VILGVCLLELFHVTAFQRVEWMTYDWRVRLAHSYGGQSPNQATNLGFVEISDNTIAAVANGDFGYKYGLYWPRQVYAQALAELFREGAQVAAFDVLFAELRPDQPPKILDDGSTIDSDEYFAGQLKRCGIGILAADQGVLPAPLFMTNAWATASIAADKDADGVLRHEQAFAEYRRWHPFINQVARAYNLNLLETQVESNQITFYRKGEGETIVIPMNAQGMLETSNFANPVPPGLPVRFAPFERVRVWSMGIVMASRQLKLDLAHPEIDLANHRITLKGEGGVVRVIPVDDQGNFYIDWSMRLNDPRLTEGPFEELLAVHQELAEGHPVPDHWRDKLVLVGSTATGNDLADLGPTPLAGNTFLATKHLNVANSIISGRFIKTTPTIVNLALIFLVGTLAAWITWVVARPVNGSALMAVTAIAYVTVAVGLFLEWRIWLPIVLPLICAGFVTHLSALTYRVTVEQSERKRIRSLFSRLVSPEVVNKVLGANSISLDSLAGERRELTVFFADIRGFTELTDAAQEANTEFILRHELDGAKADAYLDEQAREVMRTVSQYLGVIADCVKKHNGTLDKYIGDCVMAFWGAPLPNPHHAVDAVRCAMEAQQALHDLNMERKEENRRREHSNEERQETGEPLLPMLPVLSMGSGINTGMTIAGFMGSDRHIVNYTVFGREVNLASRLEGVSGFSHIVIGEGTYHALKRDAPELAKTCVERPPQIVKGFRNSVRIFEVPWQKNAQPPHQ